MQMPSGILGPLFGKIGTHYIRRTRDGFIVVPRYRTDKKSAEQIIKRKKFSWLMRTGSLLYLPFIKRYTNTSYQKIPALCDLVDQSMPIEPVEGPMPLIPLLRGLKSPFDKWEITYTYPGLLIYFKWTLADLPPYADPGDRVIIVFFQEDPLRWMITPDSLTFADCRFDLWPISALTNTYITIYISWAKYPYNKPWLLGEATCLEWWFPAIPPTGA